jgi:hypothetical protein
MEIRLFFFILFFHLSVSLVKKSSQPESDSVHEESCECLRHVCASFAALFIRQQGALLRKPNFFWEPAGKSVTKQQLISYENQI